jgi:hypothetical protein
VPSQGSKLKDSPNSGANPHCFPHFFAVKTENQRQQVENLVVLCTVPLGLTWYCQQQLVRQVFLENQDKKKNSRQLRIHRLDLEGNQNFIRGDHAFEQKIMSWREVAGH